MEATVVNYGFIGLIILVVIFRSLVIWGGYVKYYFCTAKVDMCLCSFLSTMGNKRRYILKGITLGSVGYVECCCVGNVTYIHEHCQILFRFPRVM